MFSGQKKGKIASTEKHESIRIIQSSVGTASRFEAETRRRKLPGNRFAEFSPLIIEEYERILGTGSLSLQLDVLLRCIAIIAAQSVFGLLGALRVAVRSSP